MNLHRFGSRIVMTGLALSFVFSCSQIKKELDEKEEEESVTIEPNRAKGTFTDLQAILMAKENLTVESILGKNSDTSNVRFSLNLPTTLDNGVAVTWASNRSDVISPTTGVVTRPGIGNEDQLVGLSATLSKNDVNETKGFVFTVVPLEPSEIRFRSSSQVAANQTALSSNIINDVYIHSSGKMFVGTNLGLAVSSDGVTWSTKTTEHGLAGNDVKAIVGSGDVIAAVVGHPSYLTGYLNISTNAGSTWKTIGRTGIYGGVIKPFIDSTKIYAVLTSSMYYSTDNGVNWTQIAKPAGCTSIVDFWASGASLVLGCSTGVIISSDGGSTWGGLKTTADGLGDNYVSKIAVSGTTIFAATNAGISKSTDSGATFTNTNTTTPLGYNVVTALAFAGTNVFIGYYGGTAIAFSADTGATYTSKTTSHGLGTTAVRSVRIFNDKVYYCTYDGLAVSPVVVTTFTNTTPTTTLRGYVYGSDVYNQILYVLTSEGVFRSADWGETYTQISEEYGTGIKFVGSRMYLFGYQSLKYSDDMTTFTSLGSSNGLPSAFIYGIVSDGTNLYLATNSGVSVGAVNGTSFTTKTTSDGLPNNAVRAVTYFGSKIYAATEAGLGISSDAGLSFTSKTTTDGLSSNYILSLFSNNDGIFAGTTNTNGNAFSSSDGSTFRVFGQADGISSDAIFGIFENKGRHYFLTTSGLYIQNELGGFHFLSQKDGLPSAYAAGLVVSGSHIIVTSEAGVAVSYYE